jgi:hypothetical protein
MSTGPDRRPPFPLDHVVHAPWREQAAARIAGQRFLFDWLEAQPDTARISPEMRATIHDHWDTAATAAAKRRWTPKHGGSVARITSHLDEVDTDLLRIAGEPYLRGQLPGILVSVRAHLPAGDPRREEIQQLAKNNVPAPLPPLAREVILAAQHAAGSAARREVTRLSSFQKMIWVVAAILMAGAIGLGIFGAAAPDKLPLCFAPGTYVVCPTSAQKLPVGTGVRNATGNETAVTQDRVDATIRDAADPWDIAIVEGVGLLAAGLAAAMALRGVRGTSTPYSLPIALAFLKLPTGALTAVFGLLLMRGQFIPGLSALDTSAQIIAWAALFGYSQQLLTRLVDEQAQTVLEGVGQGHEAGAAKPDAPAPTTTTVAGAH